MNTVMLIFFFFNDTATTEIYTLSLHDALPIWGLQLAFEAAAHAIVKNRLRVEAAGLAEVLEPAHTDRDRKSTRLNSSHANISYAVFCLKKKNRQACGA